MIHKSLPKADVFTSEPDSRLVSNRNNLQWHIDYFCRYYNQRIRRQKTHHGLEGVAILEAHGGGKDIWLYQDGIYRIPVQDWIDDNDGKYAALLIKACNLRASEVSSKRSLVIHPRTIFNEADMLGGRLRLRMYTPEKGYLS